MVSYFSDGTHCRGSRIGNGPTHVHHFWFWTINLQYSDLRPFWANPILWWLLIGVAGFFRPKTCQTNMLRSAVLFARVVCASTEGFFAANEGSVGLLPERNCQQLWSVHISTPLVFYCCAALIVATSAMPFDIRAIAVISHTHRWRNNQGLLI